MPTPFADIYDVFTEKINDLSLAIIEQETAEEIMYRYLQSACSKFTQSKVDLYKQDLTNKCFEDDVPREEKEILALYMVAEWLMPRLYTADVLQQTMTTKDFVLYSQANHIKELREVHAYALREAEGMAMKYTYKDGVGDLK